MDQFWRHDGQARTLTGIGTAPIPTDGIVCGWAVMPSGWPTRRVGALLEEGVNEEVRLCGKGCMAQQLLHDLDVFTVRTKQRGIRVTECVPSQSLRDSNPLRHWLIQRLSRLSGHSGCLPFVQGLAKTQSSGNGCKALIVSIHRLTSKRGGKENLPSVLCSLHSKHTRGYTSLQ